MRRLTLLLIQTIIVVSTWGQRSVVSGTVVSEATGDGEESRGQVHDSSTQSIDFPNN